MTTRPVCNGRRPKVTQYATGGVAQQSLVAIAGSFAGRRAGWLSFTKLLLAYQHSRGFSQQLEYTIDFSQPGASDVCRTIEGLEIGEYVDITLTVAGAIGETNLSNNTLTLRVTR